MSESVVVPTIDEILSLGWNTPEQDNPTLTARMIGQQLAQQNLLLLAILQELRGWEHD